MNRIAGIESGSQTCITASGCGEIWMVKNVRHLCAENQPDVFVEIKPAPQCQIEL